MQIHFELFTSQIPPHSIVWRIHPTSPKIIKCYYPNNLPIKELYFQFICLEKQLQQYNITSIKIAHSSTLQRQGQIGGPDLQGQEDISNTEIALILARFSRKHRFVTECQVYHSAINGLSFAWIFRESGWKFLKKLVLSRVYLTKKGLDWVISLDLSYLQELNLEENYICDCGAKMLLGKNFQWLQKLNLSNNLLTNKGAKCIFKMKCLKLKQIQMLKMHLSPSIWKYAGKIQGKTRLNLKISIEDAPNRILNQLSTSPFWKIQLELDKKIQGLQLQLPVGFNLRIFSQRKRLINTNTFVKTPFFFQKMSESIRQIQQNTVLSDIERYRRPEPEWTKYVKQFYSKFYTIKYSIFNATAIA